MESVGLILMISLALHLHYQPYAVPRPGDIGPEKEEGRQGKAIGRKGEGRAGRVTW